MQIQLKAVEDLFTGQVKLVEHVELGEFAHMLAKALEAAGVDLEDADVEERLDQVMATASMVLCSTVGDILRRDSAEALYATAMADLGVSAGAVIAAPVAQRTLN